MTTAARDLEQYIRCEEPRKFLPPIYKDYDDPTYDHEIMENNIIGYREPRDVYVCTTAAHAEFMDGRWDYCFCMAASEKGHCQAVDNLIRFMRETESTKIISDPKTGIPVEVKQFRWVNPIEAAG